jgi:hypothetical protein
VLGLSGLQKVTARLIDGIDIQHSSTQFTVSFVTVVPFFRVTEDVPLDGGSVQLGRRDLRFGRQSNAARSVPGGVLVEMSWGAPLAGGCLCRCRTCMTYVLASPHACGACVDDTCMSHQTISCVYSIRMRRDLVYCMPCSSFVTDRCRHWQLPELLAAPAAARMPCCRDIMRSLLPT